MKKRWKSCLIVLAFIVITLFGTQAVLADDTGKCGNNISWALDDAGNLTVNGIGAITDYLYTDPFSSPRARSPFDSRNDIKTVNVGYGVTRIGNYTFSDCNNLRSITLPSSVTSIGREAFCGCNKLTDVYYGGNKDQWNRVEVGEHVLVELANSTIHYDSINVGSKLPDITNKSITLNRNKIEISKGESYKLIATLSGVSKTVTWTSSNKKIATVKDGIVTGKKKGTVTITAMCGKLKATCTVTVKMLIDVESFYMQYMRDNYEQLAYPNGIENSLFRFYYMFYDVDLDGVQELFIRREQGTRGCIMLFGFDGKKVYPLIEDGGGIGISVRPGHNQLLISEGTQAYGLSTACKKKGKKLEKLYTLYFSKINGEGNDVYKYNGTVITEQKYNNYIQLFKKNIFPEIEFDRVF